MMFVVNGFQSISDASLPNPLPFFRPLSLFPVEFDSHHVLKHFAKIFTLDGLIRNLIIGMCCGWGRDRETMDKIRTRSIGVKISVFEYIPIGIILT